MSRSCLAAIALFASTGWAAENYDASWQRAQQLIDEGTLATDAQKQKQLYTEAESAARDAVRLNPDGAKGHTFLAIAVGKLALFHGGRQKVELSKEVKTEAERALALDPKDDLAYHVLGVWNREMVELNWFLKKVAELLYGAFPPASMDNALQQLRQAVTLAPAKVAHRVELGKTLAAAGNAAEARKALEAAIAMPKSWVTDDVYKNQAREALKSL